MNEEKNERLFVKKTIIKAMLDDYDDYITRIDNFDGYHHQCEEDEGIDRIMNQLRALVDGVKATMRDRELIPSSIIHKIYARLDKLESNETPPNS